MEKSGKARLIERVQKIQRPHPECINHNAFGTDSQDQYDTSPQKPGHDHSVPT